MPDLNILLPIVCTFRKELEKSCRLTSYMQNCHCLTVIITSTFITPNPVTVSKSALNLIHKCDSKKKFDHIKVYKKMTSLLL